MFIWLTIILNISFFFIGRCYSQWKFWDPKILLQAWKKNEEKNVIWSNRKFVNWLLRYRLWFQIASWRPRSKHFQVYFRTSKSDQSLIHFLLVTGTDCLLFRLSLILLLLLQERPSHNIAQIGLSLSSKVSFCRQGKWMLSLTRDVNWNGFSIDSQICIVSKSRTDMSSRSMKISGVRLRIFMLVNPSTLYEPTFSIYWG